MLLLIMFYPYALIHMKTCSVTELELPVFTHTESSWMGRLSPAADPEMLGI